MSVNLGEVFTGGASTSQHVDAEDDDHFQNTTFKLKRTRSLGLLDEFIDPEKQEKQIEKKSDERKETQSLQLSAPSSSSSSSSAPSYSTSSSTSTQGPTSTPESSQPSPLLHSYLKSPDIIPHDDTDLVPEPSRHVDYLSHQWDVSDISKSWRYVILRRKNVANAARLENASWRTWAQRRSNLKTISPEEVNWSKESDVTWLYGPIVDDDDHDHDNETEHHNAHSSLNTASSVVAGDISISRKAHRTKPILKKRTVQDMMISHLNLLKLQVATARAEQEQIRREDAAAQARQDAAARSGTSERPPEYFDYNAISAKLNSQYKNFSQTNSRSGSLNNSSVDLVEKKNAAVSASEVSAALEKESSGASTLQHMDSSPSDSHPVVASESVPKEDRHIHFNDEVQQCVAINEYSDEDNYDDFDDYDYDYGDDESYIYELKEMAESQELSDDENDEDEDEGGFFLNVRTSSYSSLAGTALPGLSSANKNTKESENTEDSESISTSSSKVFKTIHLLPPTTLNYGSSDEESDDLNPYTSSISHNIDNTSSRGYDYYYDYNTVYQVDPNHAIYSSYKKQTTPDVIDLPENISLGSNMDYEIIENEDIGHFENVPVRLLYDLKLSPEILAQMLSKAEKLPISSLDDSTSRTKPNPFSFDASDSDEDSDDDDESGGLSIQTRTSSQSLAQQVFGNSMTPAGQEEHHFPQQFSSEPEQKHISSINPRYSSSELSKQPHSSNSLLNQFFGVEMTTSKSNLMDLFLNSNPDPVTSLSSPSVNSFSETQSPPIQRKSSPLPPYTTSANAFVEINSQLAAKSIPKRSFVFDSGSDSEDESEDDVPREQASYASLYEVAGRTGIAVPSQEASDESASKDKKLAMSNFLGSWNKN